MAEQAEDTKVDKKNCCKLAQERETLNFYVDLLNRKNSWRKKTVLEIPVNCRFLEEEIREQLHRNIKFAHIQLTESFMEVEIQDTGIEIIEDNIEPGTYQNILLEEYRRNCQRNMANKFQFYTDGSVGRTSDQEKKMGIAWIQTEGPNIGSSFAASLSDWPTSYKAELTAIIIAALTVPTASEVEVVTDSASCISAFNKMIKANPRRTTRRWIKEKNWSLWMRFAEIIRRKKLKIQLKKVKAHSGHRHNDMADKLAKEGREALEIIWQDPRRPIWSVMPVWNNFEVDMSIRDFMKEIHKKETLVDWTQQNRVQKRWAKEIEEQETHSWKMVWEQSRQGSSLQTTIKQAKERSFRTKLMNDELPTFDNLVKRRPELYTRKTCLLCDREEENTEHLFACPGTRDKQSQVWKEVRIRTERLLNKIQKRRPAGQGKDRGKVQEKITGDKLLRLIREWENICGNSGREQINMCVGLFDMSKKQAWNKVAKEDGLKAAESKEVLDSLSNNLLRTSRKKIWIPRCEEVIAWEKMQGIVSRIKKKKESPERKKPARGRPKTGEVKDTAKRTRSRGIAGLKEKVIEITRSWIKEGKKWLGY
jgi:ribonuclease HI